MEVNTTSSPSPAELFASSTRAVPASAGADLLLQLGASLHAAAVHADRPPDAPPRLKARAAIEQAEVAVATELYAHPPRPPQRALFNLGKAGKKLDRLWVRVLAYVAYAQALTDSPWSSLQALARAVALEPDSCVSVLQARDMAQSLAYRKIIAWRDGKTFGSGWLLMGQRLAEWVTGQPAERGWITERKLRQRWQADAARQAKTCRALPSTNRTGCTGPNVQRLFAQLKTVVHGMPEPVLRSFCARIGIHLQRVARLQSHPEIAVAPEVILVLGPSGAGKTYLANQAARISGINFASVDCGSLTAEGYVGQNIDSCLRAVVNTCGDFEKAQRNSICLLDEFDKKASNSSQSHLDIGGHAVQEQLLKYLEGGLVTVGGRRSFDDAPRNFSTAGLAWILCGAFSGLDDIIRRLAGEQSALGFASAARPGRVAARLHDALGEYGMIPELVNRLTSIIHVPAPDHAALDHILTASVLPGYGQLLGGDATSFDLDADARRLVVEFAHETATYARGLKSLVSKLAEAAVFAGNTGPVRSTLTDVQAAIDALAGVSPARLA